MSVQRLFRQLSAEKQLEAVIGIGVDVSSCYFFHAYSYSKLAGIAIAISRSKVTIKFWYVQEKELKIEISYPLRYVRGSQGHYFQFSILFL